MFIIQYHGSHHLARSTPGGIEIDNGRTGALLERATTYRDKKIKPLFLQIKNKVAAMAAQVKELTKEVENWKSIYVSRKGDRKAALYKDENKNC